MSPINPCLLCGACCAYFRVSFYWLETDSSMDYPVPVDLAENLPPQRMCMKGTNQLHPRCVALVGEVGNATACAIYNNRPSPCREFGVHFIDDTVVASFEEMERCNRARAVWNLPPILLDEYGEAPEEGTYPVVL